MKLNKSGVSDNKAQKNVSDKKQEVHDRARQANEKLGLPAGTSWELSPILDFSTNPRLSLLPDMFRQMSVAYMAFKYGKMEEEDRDVSVFDAGCGFGETYAVLSQMRKARGVQLTYIGMDVDPRKKERADKLLRHIDFRLGDVTKDMDAVVPERGFDVVVSSEVLEHLTKEDGIKYLEQCMERLIPGGTMILTTPSEKRIDVNPWHLYEWSYDELLEHIVDSGWLVLDSFFMKPKVASLDEEFSISKRKMRMPSEVLRAVLFGDHAGAQSVFVFTKD